MDGQAKKGNATTADPDVARRLDRLEARVELLIELMKKAKNSVHTNILS